jgi:hypothetical protein
MSGACPESGTRRFCLAWGWLGVSENFWFYGLRDAD